MGEDVFQMYLEEIDRIESCGKEENQRLLKELERGGQVARDRLIEGNLKLALELVQGYLNRGVPAGDLAQEANMALVLAVSEYEGGSFEDFVKARVKEALISAVDQQSKEDETARKMVERVNRLKDISQELAEELGREATVDELAERMKMTAQEVRELMKLTLDAMNVVGD